METSGYDYAMVVGGGLGIVLSQPRPQINYVVYVPMIPHDDLTTVEMWWMNGAGTAGNTDVGLYAASFAALFRSGPTPNGAINTLQRVPAVVNLTAGTLYWMALWADDIATQRFYSWSITAQGGFDAAGNKTETGAVGGLPNPMTPVPLALPGNSNLPRFGLSCVSLA